MRTISRACSKLHLHLNEERRQGKKCEGGVPDSWLEVRKRGRGGGHSNAYSVQQGCRGGSKNREKMHMEGPMGFQYKCVQYFGKGNMTPWMYAGSMPDNTFDHSSCSESKPAKSY